MIFEISIVKKNYSSITKNKNKNRKGYGQISKNG